MKSVKVFLPGNEIKRFQVSGFDDFCSKILKLGGIKVPNDKMKAYYLDCEQDWVSFHTHEEWSEGVNCHATKIMKIQLVQAGLVPNRGLGRRKGWAGNPEQTNIRIEKMKARIERIQHQKQNQQERIQNMKERIRTLNGKLEKKKEISAKQQHKLEKKIERKERQMQKKQEKIERKMTKKDRKIQRKTEKLNKMLKEKEPKEEEKEPVVEMVYCAPEEKEEVKEESPEILHKLGLMAQMGFTDVGKNTEVLKKHKGNIQSALAELLK